MTKKSCRGKFIVLSILLVIGIFLSFFRFDIPWTDKTYNGFINAIQLGFDLQGGTSIVFDADLPDDNLEGDLNKSIEATIGRIKLLLDSKGYSEHNVYRQGNDKIRVEVPNLIAQTDTDYFFEQLEKPASFKMTKEEGLDKEAFLTGKHIENVQYMAQNNEYGVLEHGYVIQFNDEGKNLFSDLTSEVSSSSGTIYIYVGEDTNPVTRLSANGAITNGTVFVSSETMTEQQAKDTALKLLSGSFDSKLTLLENNVVSASLGVNASKFGMIAVFVALVIFMILMFVFFGDFGLLANLGLIIWGILLLFFLQALPFVVFSLSSFAGVIMSLVITIIGLTITYKKIESEYKSGKKLHMSVKNGVNKSIALVADYHVVSIIAALVLLIVGSSSIKGFAIVFLIGTILSGFISLLVIRWLLKIYFPLNSTKANKFRFKREEILNEH